MAKRKGPVREDLHNGNGPESTEAFLDRFVSGGQCDDVFVRTVTRTGQRSVVVGTATFLSDRSVKPGASDRNVEFWATSKAFYAAVNILIDLDEDEDAKLAERLARKYWSRMKAMK